ncbi:bestrophin family protein [Beijerinckia sp. L45]|uniref:bestrophin family protein n=1 Tax=Beijerinckia sp. L45 TaxID=1641855 RepID=UPI00131E990A|nr:bestrophin family ion channel [Beijerinckia sp. L45]
MIVGSTPRIGHAAREIIGPLAVLFVWDVIVTLIYFWINPKIMQLEVPLSLFGTALALFLGFRDNSAYARWWEARSLWGLMINASRSLARQALSLCDARADSAGLRRAIVCSQIAYVHQLRTGLRGEADGAEITTYLAPDQAAAVKVFTNQPNAILTDTAILVSDAFRAGLIDSFGRVRIETTLVDIANAQGGMERIKRTPMPSQYRFFPVFFTRIFCVILPFAVVRDLGVYTPVGSAFVGLMFLILLQIGDDLMDPFSNEIYDVPMSAMCRTVEIDLLQMLGEPAPEPLAPENGVLW